MFPFTLAGPQFLLFYAVFSVVVIGAYWIYISSGGAGAKVRLSELTDDPYKIALLRADREEAVRVAIVNLVDRGLLEASGLTLVTRKGASLEFVRRPLDRAILQFCAESREFSAIHEHAAVRAACANYERELETKGLLLNEDEKRSRMNGLTVALLILGGIAAARILQALSRGQFNLIFLIMLAAVACFIAYRVYRGRITAAGRQALSSLQTLTQRLQRQVDKLRAGGATNEALLLAAVFGIYALPAAAFTYVEQIFPKPRRDSSSCSSGSSCGSSSCGGGGGCGGCGGD